MPPSVRYPMLPLGYAMKRSRANLISPRVLTKVENAVKVEPVGELSKGIRRPLAAYNVVAAVRFVRLSLLCQFRERRFDPGEHRRLSELEKEAPRLCKMTENSINSTQTC